MIGASIENSEGTAFMNVCVCVTQLHKQSFNYPVSCLVGPASIPVERPGNLGSCPNLQTVALFAVIG